MKIGEVARQAGVTKDTVRHYVSQGLLSAQRDNTNGYQIFGDDAVSRLGFIRTARQLGFHLDDIKQIFNDAESGNSPCPRVRDVMQHRIDETRKTIAELTALCDRMEAGMAEWQSMTDSVPDGKSVCRLIESQISVVKSHT